MQCNSLTGLGDPLLKIFNQCNGLVEVVDLISYRISSISAKVKQGWEIRSLFNQCNSLTGVEDLIPYGRSSINVIYN